MQSSEEADLSQTVGVVLEALRMKSVSFQVLVSFWKFFKNGYYGAAALYQVIQTGVLLKSQ